MKIGQNSEQKNTLESGRLWNCHMLSQNPLEVCWPRRFGAGTDQLTTTLMVTDDEGRLPKLSYFFGQRPIVPFLLLSPQFFLIILFVSTMGKACTPCKCNGLWLLSLMAVFSKGTIDFFCYGSCPRDRPCPYLIRSLTATFWHLCMEWNNVWVSTKPLISEEIWPGWGLNP
jgi:hypothetical protein